MESVKKFIDLTNSEMQSTNGGIQCNDQTEFSTCDCTSVSCGEGYDYCDDTDPG